MAAPARRVSFSQRRRGGREEGGRKGRRKGRREGGTARALDQNNGHWGGWAPGVRRGGRTERGWISGVENKVKE